MPFKEIGVLLGYVVPAIQLSPVAAFFTAVTKRRVLIVDDDVSLACLSAMTLETSGSYEVVTENDALRALEVARRFRPHVILLNIDMPDKSGGDLALRLASDSFLCHVPILFLIGSATRKESEQPDTVSSAMLFLRKPVNPELLLERVGKLAKVTLDT